jgi:hypothetical protein
MLDRTHTRRWRCRCHSGYSPPDNASQVVVWVAREAAATVEPVVVELVGVGVAPAELAPVAPVVAAGHLPRPVLTSNASLSLPRIGRPFSHSSLAPSGLCAAPRCCQGSPCRRTNMP